MDKHPQQYSGAERESSPLGTYYTTRLQTPTRMSWGFLLGDRAGCRVLSGVRAETCGLRLRHHHAGPGSDSLSCDQFSLRRRGSSTCRSPQDTHNRVNQINGLQVVEAIGSIQELVAKLIVTQRMSGQGTPPVSPGPPTDDQIGRKR